MATLEVPQPIERVHHLRVGAATLHYKSHGGYSGGGRSDCPRVMLLTRRTFLGVVVFAGTLLGVALGSLWSSAAGASYVERSALDQISRTYEIPVASPEDHVTGPSVLFVTSATLDTDRPGDRAVHAPPGMIYLSLQATSRPVQHQYGEPGWGSFFSNMTPLPASALRYVTASGRPYPATRVDPINQTYNSDASADDGLVDATYYFTVPITSRSGTIIISRCQTMGTQYVGFVGGAPTPLDVGGPTRIAVQFPRQLTTASTPTTTIPVAPYTTAASFMNLSSTAISVLFIAFIYFAFRRRRRRSMRSGRGAEGGSIPPTAPAAPTMPPKRSAKSPARPPSHATNDRGSTSSTLRIGVLGPLLFDPPLPSASDPARALLAYLALHDDRARTVDDVQTALWPLSSTRKDISRRSFLNYVSEARKAVGSNHLPDFSGKAGYQLRDVRTDWGEFRDLATRAQGATGSESAALRRRALSLVRGQPFESDLAHYFEWIRVEGFDGEIARAVLDLAHRASTDLILAGDLLGAEECLRRGLLVAPASTLLWEQLTDVLLEHHDPAVMALHWKQAAAVLEATEIERLQEREHG